LAFEVYWSMRGAGDPLVSILIPARNEERTLPTTLPTVLDAAGRIGRPAEIIVIAPTVPEIQVGAMASPRLRWLATGGGGKFHALRTGAGVARGEILLMVDADVLVEPGAFRLIAQPIVDDTADVVAGRIVLAPSARRPVQFMLERWAAISFASWDVLRSHHSELLWALPGALYGVRRRYLPADPLVPLVDDVSVGLYAKETGARFSYVRTAIVRTRVPQSLRGWLKQRYRGRRGWAALARLRGPDVAHLRRTLRHYRRAGRRGDPTAWLMEAQDAAVRTAAAVSTWLAPTLPTGWVTPRTWAQWPERPEETRHGYETENA
jgi:cellulose synthase/poly-beta-1,6-N-acetylglucosamine synthase-like glycosyltransferase